MRGGGRPLDGEVLNDRWKAYERRKQWAAAAGYISKGFGETRWASVKAVPVCGRAEQVRIGEGLRLLSLCRTNGLWTAKKRAGAKFIHSKYKKLCPCCGIVGGRDSGAYTHELWEVGEGEEAAPRGGIQRDRGHGTSG